jgi:demethylmenaquinone methyltransferase/2-methoxy-6-polyprenyl-1,4-benzoquinol methylase
LPRSRARCTARRAASTRAGEGSAASGSATRSAGDGGYFNVALAPLRDARASLQGGPARRGRESIPETLPTARRFDRVAPRYDFVNKLMSMGQDRRWRAALVGALGDRVHGWALDLGCGTGDVSLALRDAGARVVGVDPSRGMLALARAKDPGIAWVQADALHLPFRAGSFDASTSAFVLRNLPDREAAFREQARALRPGGRAAHLELVRPAKGLQRALHGAYVRVAVPALGVLSSDRASYRYLAGTVLEVPQPETFATELQRAGLVAPRVERMALGGVAVVAADKPPVQQPDRKPQA